MIFTTQMGRIDYANAPDALKKMADHIRYIQEQLEYTLTNLDSSNIVEIDTDETNVSSATGTGVSNTRVSIEGDSGEQFTAGKNPSTNRYEFTLKGKNGEQLLYMTSDGKLVITRNATIVVDGGTW